MEEMKFFTETTASEENNTTMHKEDWQVYDMEWVLFRGQIEAIASSKEERFGKN